MTHYAQHPPQTRARLSPATLYWRGSGFLLAAVAALGTVTMLVVEPDAGGQAVLLGGNVLQFSWMVNAVHVLFAAVSLLLGYRVADAALRRNAALGFGTAYLALGAAGVLSPGLFGLGDLTGMTMDWTENLAHLGLGAWGILAARAA